MFRATIAGTGGNSPTHVGASPCTETGATKTSLCSGSASTIVQVRPAITNCLIRPFSSSPLPFNSSTKASSTFPMVRRVTTSRTR